MYIFCFCLSPFKERIKSDNSIEVTLSKIFLPSDKIKVSLDDNLSVEQLPLRKGYTINVLGRVAAGLPIEAIENIIDTEEISEEMARTGEYFGLQIHGNSMEPRMYEGDIVIVRKQDDAESGDIVIAMVNGNDAVCKRLQKYAGGISLISLNSSNYDPMIYSNEDTETKPVKIIGKVVELRSKF